MANKEGTLRLVAGGAADESSVGVGATTPTGLNVPPALPSGASAAYGSVKSALTVVAQHLSRLHTTYPNSPDFTQLLSEFQAVATAVDALALAATPAPTPNAPISIPSPASPGSTAPISLLQDAEGQLNQLTNELKKLGYTVAANPNSKSTTDELIITPPSGGLTRSSPGTLTPPGGYSIGQAAAVGVAGALAGWFGNDFWREHRGRLLGTHTHRRRS